MLLKAIKMRTVEKYQSFSEHLFDDDRVRKYGMMLVQHGFKGAVKKINPAVMYVDAALSVFEAVNSYLNYAKEREVTKQILAENKKIEAELKAQLQIMQLRQETVLKWGRERVKELSNHILLTEKQTINMIKQVNRQISIAKSMQSLLRKERENGVEFIQLQELQKKLDHYLRSCLLLIMDNVE